jgi:hypothetical protein
MKIELSYQVPARRIKLIQTNKASTDHQQQTRKSQAKQKKLRCNMGSETIRSK